jgi:hypothetical protein
MTQPSIQLYLYTDIVAHKNAIWMAYHQEDRWKSYRTVDKVKET